MEDGEEPWDWSDFANDFEDIKIMKRSFYSSELIHIPQTHNSMADSLTHSVKKIPVWFAEFKWVCLRWWQQKMFNRIFAYININQPNVSTGIQCGICVFISFNSGHDLIYESKSSLTFSQWNIKKHTKLPSDKFRLPFSFFLQDLIDWSYKPVSIWPYNISSVSTCSQCYKLIP